MVKINYLYRNCLLPFLINNFITVIQTYREEVDITKKTFAKLLATNEIS